MFGCTPALLSFNAFVPNNVPLSTPTCEDGGANHFALLTAPDSVEADLVFRSRKQARQGVVGHIAVNHHAVDSTCRTTSEGRRVTPELLPPVTLIPACLHAGWRAARKKLGVGFFLFASQSQHLIKTGF